MKAPFTDEQVARIQEWQADKYVHPLTCGNENCCMTLDVTKDGLVCPLCGYTQDWVHDCIANPINPHIFEKPVKTNEYLRGIEDWPIYLWKGEKYYDIVNRDGDEISPFLWHTDKRHGYPGIICKCGCHIFELDTGDGYAQGARCINCGATDDVYSG